MAKRKIIKIDEEKCNGCGQCIPNCREGAIKLINGKARLISEAFCDGLGVCIGHCPQGAITIEERDAQEYDEIKVQEAKVHSGHMHQAIGCPGAKIMDFRHKATTRTKDNSIAPQGSRLGQWPVQIMLVPENAPYFKNADLFNVG